MSLPQSSPGSIPENQVQRAEAAGPTHEPVRFRGGPVASAIPLFTFLIIATLLVIGGAPKDEGMILAAMAGISLGMPFAYGVANYSERVFSLMANRIATVAVICWLWAGAFSGILANSGLVEAIVWIGWKMGLTGAAFTVAVFVSAALFAVSVGTGLGTIIGFTAVMFPAGVVLGGHPAALMGAIFSGAAFGDNFAPISDTTIVSAATQETDVGGVVKSRLKYVAIAALISAGLFAVFGGQSGGDMSAETAQALLAETANPKGLPMLIPPAIVFIVAVSGFHFLGALTAGILAAVVLGPIVGVFSFGDLFHITDAGTIEGFAVKGAMGMVPVSILTLLLVTAIGLMAEGGFLGAMMSWLDRTLARTVRGAEAAILVLITFANLCVSVNTVAMITAGPLANELRKRHGIHPYRAANLMDTVSCSFPYILPYAAVVSAALVAQQAVADKYDFIEMVGWASFAPYMFYAHVMFPLMILAVVTGFGRRRG